jgi:Na+/melibiose symporter-like transporter
MGQGIAGGLAIYFNTYFWELPSSRLLVLTLAGLIAMPAAAVLASYVSRAVGKKWATAGFMLAALAASATPIGLRLLDLLPPNGSPALIAVLFCERVLTPMCDGAALILIYSMLSDVIDESELKTGRRSEGLLISAGVTLQKVLGGVAAVIPGLILAAVAFPREAQPGAVPQDVLRNLALSYLPASAAMSALAIACVVLYRIDRRRHESTLMKLREEDPLGLAEDTAERAAGSPRGLGV